MKRNATFLHFKKRIQSFIASGIVSKMTYQNPIFFENGQCKFFPLKIRGDEDVESMFLSHEHSGMDCIELYITLQPCIPSQQSQLTDQDAAGEDAADDAQWSDELNPEAEVEVDVVDEEEEETEIQVDHMLNNDDEDDDQPPPIPPSHVYNPPQHMTNMDLHDDETSNNVFYNPYLR